MLDCAIDKSTADFFDDILRETWEKNKSEDMSQASYRKREVEKVEQKMSQVEMLMLRTTNLDLLQKLEADRVKLQSDKQLLEREIKNGLFTNDECLNLLDKVK